MIANNLKFIITVILISCTIIFDINISANPAKLSRKKFIDFPDKIDSWKSIDIPIGEEELKILNPTDYLLRDYRTKDGASVDLYIAYFENQTEESRIHSPRGCLPGGGWKIISLSDHSFNYPNSAEGTLTVKKAVVQKGINKMAMFFWIYSGGRIFSNEYLSKAYLLYDSLARRRSDGALVRLTTPVSESEEENNAIKRLEKFVHLSEGSIREYIPAY